MNKEERRLYAIEYRKKNYIRLKKYRTEYISKNKERIRERRKIYNTINKERLSKQQKKFYIENPERVNAVRRKCVYGISDNEFKDLIKSQNDLCCICKKVMGNTFDRVVDHDHKTNKVRGLLCRKCNCALGLFGDDQEKLKSALVYLERFNSNHVFQL